MDKGIFRAARPLLCLLYRLSFTKLCEMTFFFLSVISIPVSHPFFLLLYCLNSFFPVAFFFWFLLLARIFVCLCTVIFRHLFFVFLSAFQLSLFTMRVTSLSSLFFFAVAVFFPSVLSCSRKRYLYFSRKVSYVLWLSVRVCMVLFLFLVVIAVFFLAPIFPSTYLYFCLFFSLPLIICFFPSQTGLRG